MSTDTKSPEAERKARRRELRKLATKVTRAEDALDAAIAERDAALIDAHGDKRTGRLSYEELHQEVGISKGRVIQIVQGNSEFSKRQMAARNGDG